MREVQQPAIHRDAAGNSKIISTLLSARPPGVWPFAEVFVVIDGAMRTYGVTGRVQDRRYAVIIANLSIAGPLVKIE